MNFFANLIAFFIAYLFLIGVSIGEQGFAKATTLEERRKENDRIQEVIRKTIIDNKQPSPAGSPRIARILRNSYRNRHPQHFPKTIYRFPIRPPFPTGHKRFFGGIPR